MASRFTLCLATVLLVGALAPAQVIFHEDFNDNSAGWSLGPQWAIGPATAGLGCGLPNGDPGSDADGKAGGGVAGVVLGGCTGTALHGQYFIESPAIDTTGSTSLKLEFDRWLNSDYQGYMNSVVQVWNGSAWATVFSTPCCNFIQDSSWNHISYDITAYSSPRLKVRFGYDIGSSGVVNTSGWNIDNVRISNAEYFNDRFASNAAGWTLDTEWAIGNATAGGSAFCSGGAGDPGFDADGTTAGGVAGVVLGGNCTGAIHGYYFLTSPVINTAGSTLLFLKYDRWLNGDYNPYQNSIVQVWDGGSWQTVFSVGNGCGTGQVNNSWQTALHNIQAFSNAALQVRFGYANLSSGVIASSQWNLDNVQIYDPTGACTLGLSAYAGPGSIRVSAHCLGPNVPPGTQLFNCLTTNQGNFPNGYFAGIDPSFTGEVLVQYGSNALPFVGNTNGLGDVVWDLPAGVPAGIPVFGVTIAIGPGGFPVGVSPPIAFVTQ